MQDEGGRKKRLFTTALPYVNNVPHLGNLVQGLSGDVCARYSRLCGHDTLYICGTDEYGTATETRAREEGIAPKELCDRYYDIHREVYEWFDFSFDIFGRTSDPIHTDITQDIFNKVYANGYITAHTTEQFYSKKSQMFLPDRYVNGTCPHCGYAHARGDQCEQCGVLLDPADLRDARSAIDGSVPVMKKTQHLYLNLPKLVPLLEQWLQETRADERWVHNAVQMTRAWMRDGLRERAITRDLSWGIPVPLQEYAQKVFYVWFDACIGYISITAQLTDAWRDWWQSPQDTHLYQFVGKDNIPFHTVIFPSSLLGSGERWTMVHHISSTEYLNYEGGQFSKSRGVGVFGTDAMESGIPADVWRFYLLYNRPETADYTFTWDDFYARTNKELIGNFANFFNRLTTFVHRYYDGKLFLDSVAEGRMLAAEVAADGTVDAGAAQAEGRMLAAEVAADGTVDAGATEATGAEHGASTASPQAEGRMLAAEVAADGTVDAGAAQAGARTQATEVTADGTVDSGAAQAGQMVGARAPEGQMAADGTVDAGAAEVAGAEHGALTASQAEGRTLATEVAQAENSTPTAGQVTADGTVDAGATEATGAEHGASTASQAENSTPTAGQLAAGGAIGAGATEAGARTLAKEVAQAENSTPTTGQVTAGGAIGGGAAQNKRLAAQIVAYAQEMSDIVAKVQEKLENIEIRDALRTLLQLSDLGNKIFQEHEPWKNIANKPDDTTRILSFLALVARNLAILIAPFLPQTARKCYALLGIAGELRWQDLWGLSRATSDDLPAAGSGASSNVPAAGAALNIQPSTSGDAPAAGSVLDVQPSVSGDAPAAESILDVQPSSSSAVSSFCLVDIKEPQILFKRFEKKDIAAFKNIFGGMVQGASTRATSGDEGDDTTRVSGNKNNGAHADVVKKEGAASQDMRTQFTHSVKLIAVKIVAATKHHNADTLFIVQVDDGQTAARQIVSGLSKYYRTEELVGKTVVLVDNLKGSKIRGVMSNGMVLAAESANGDALELLEVDAAPGTQVGLEGSAPSLANHEYRRIKATQFFDIAIVVKKNSVTIDGCALICNGHALHTTKIIDGTVS